MKNKERLLIIPILGLMIGATSLYGYKVLKENNYDLNQTLIEGVQEFQEIQRGSYTTQNFYTENDTPSYSLNISNPIKTSSGYSALSSKGERMLYNIIKDNADHITNNRNNSGFYQLEPITIRNYVFNSEQIKKVLYAVQNDHPEIFWFANSFSFNSGRFSTTIKLHSILSPEEQKRASDLMNKKVFNIISQIPSNASAYEKELFIHDYLVDNCTYSKNAVQDPKIFTSYGCLVEEKAVCEGYAKAAQILMCAAGIECRTVIGARGSEAHMWNMVNINGDWYHVDVTWENKDPIRKYSYFNVTDDIIKRDHKIAISKTENPEQYYRNQYYNFDLPRCTSLKENYFEKNAAKINKKENLTDNTIPSKIAALKSEQQTILYIKIHDNIKFEEAKNTLLKNNSKLIFEHINKANSISRSGKSFGNSQIKYAEIRNQNVIAIQLM